MSVRPPTHYDASSPSELASPLPAAPRRRIGPAAVLQPPLSRRGSGPGLILVLAADALSSGRAHGLDPRPVQRWAEEGFAVVGLAWPAAQLRDAVDALAGLASVDGTRGLGLVVYDDSVVEALLADLVDTPAVSCAVVLDPVSRTVGPDRIVDEFVFRCTHSCLIPWLLPHVPPSGASLAVPMVAVVGFRGDRLCHEHIWWDQATALRQVRVLPTHVPAPGGRGRLRLPVAGVESARLLRDPMPGESNEMLDPDWATE